ncbi:MAG TPA: hypothetical protein VF929_04705 [Gemmatimonadaceae bacterium]
MPLTLPPYALASPTFRFRHLANLAGRAQIGGAREVALACFVAARLAADAGNGAEEGASGRTTRSTAARAWLGTLTLPTPVRSSAARCAESSAGGRTGTLARELTGLMQAAAAYLDAPARHELEVLAASLKD